MEAELHRLNGEALLALSPVRWAEAEACYRQALAVARGQAAHLWELRAAVGLARLWRGQGRLGEGHDPPGPGLRLVHRRLRHARPEGRQGAA
jgi:predicted ATPase